MLQKKLTLPDPARDTMNTMDGDSWDDAFTTRLGLTGAQVLSFDMSPIYREGARLSVAHHVSSPETG